MAHVEVLELHDSSANCRREGKAILIALCPAYVHHWEQIAGTWHGEGRAQHAQILVHDGQLSPDVGEDTVKLADGWLDVAGDMHSNLIPASLDVASTVRARFEVVGSAPVDVTGVGVSIQLIGESQRIESLPLDWAPDGRS